MTLLSLLVPDGSQCDIILLSHRVSSATGGDKSLVTMRQATHARAANHQHGHVSSGTVQ